jgi:hypothetical protein
LLLRERLGRVNTHVALREFAQYVAHKQTRNYRLELRKQLFNFTSEHINACKKMHASNTLPSGKLVETLKRIINSLYHVGVSPQHTEAKQRDAAYLIVLVRVCVDNGNVHVLRYLESNK